MADRGGVLAFEGADRVGTLLWGWLVGGRILTQTPPDCREGGLFCASYGDLWLEGQFSRTTPGLDEMRVRHRLDKRADLT